MISALRKLLNGVDTLFGDVVPRRAVPTRAHQPVDGRTAALRVLRAYVSSLVFYLPMDKSDDAGPLVGAVKPFKLLPQNFFLETPSTDQSQVYPSIAVVTQGDIPYEGRSFTPVLLEDTRDVFGRGTALVRHHLHVEKFALEVWATTPPELRSLVAGLESAFNPIEGRAGLLFKMPQYFNVPARFLLTGRENFEDSSSALGRRHVQLKVAMDFYIVSLVNVTGFKPQVSAGVGYDPATNLAVDLSCDPTASQVLPADAADLHHWSRVGRTVS